MGQGLAAATLPSIACLVLILTHLPWLPMQQKLLHHVRAVLRALDETCLFAFVDECGDCPQPPARVTLSSCRPVGIREFATVF
jgi:hypothetical protein